MTDEKIGQNTSAPSPKYDVVTLGETMLRLSPPHLQRLAQATQFEIHVGGSESNVAIGLAGLGLAVAWISRLTRNALGEFISQGVQRYGVDASHIIWTDHQRVGLYFLEEGSPPRNSDVIYDRAESAMCYIQPDDLATFPGSRLVHLSGITPALSKSAAETAQHLMHSAKNQGSLISFDTNLRLKLWSASTARPVCESFMREADIIFIPLKDANAMYGEQSSETHLHQLHHQFSQSVIVMTLGKDGAVSITPEREIYQQSAYPAERVGPVGGGDAFCAGFLYQYLQNNQDIPQALKWGAACAAYKYTIPGDIPLFSRAEIQALIDSLASHQHKPLVRR